MKKDTSNPLTPEQQLEAWRLLMAGGDNTDATIAKKMGLPRQRVTHSLALMEKKKMDRINQQVNERYEDRKKNEHAVQKKRTKASQAIQV